MSSSSSAPLFENNYRWRKAEKDSSCWICLKPTVHVLISGEHADWFYICESHINDPSFCKILPPQTPTQSQSDISSLSGMLNTLTTSVTSAAGSALNNLTGGSSNKPATPPASGSGTTTPGGWPGASTTETGTAPAPAAGDAKKDSGEAKKEGNGGAADGTAKSDTVIVTGPRYVRLDAKIFYLRENEKRKKINAKEKMSKLQQLQGVTVPKTPPTNSPKMPGGF
ncbi:hypothetical protein HDU76_013980 [Blyttiomyces sp. JEL0837]|nr:hypothetical protein HDU76_013980 [Blyttiomyces sp. JEL0837]